MNLREELFKNQDLKYRDFQCKLLPTVNREEIIGVRLPILRRLARRALKEQAENRLEYCEEKMVYGFVLGLKKGTADMHKEDLKRFVPLIDNWSICDSCCASFKFTRQYKAELFPFVKAYIGKGEYETRFAVVMLMDYYLEDDYIDAVLPLLFAVKSDAYYVNMAVAWAISVAYVKYREKTLPLLEAGLLSDAVMRMTVQKLNDSYRVSREDKIYLKQLKNK